MRRTAADKQRWIEETKLYQRISGVPESSDEDLARDWDEMHRPATRRARPNQNTAKN